MMLCLNSFVFYNIDASAPGPSGSKRDGRKSDGGAAAGTSEKNEPRRQEPASKPVAASSRKDASAETLDVSSSMAGRKRIHRGMFLPGPRFKEL